MKQKLSLTIALAGMLAGGNLVFGGGATFNFDGATDLEIFTNLPADNPPLRSTGGNPGGYLAITDAAGGQGTKIIFPDFDEGLIVKAFSFSMDVRVGNGTTDRPADGFSISYARANDPVLETNDPFAGMAAGIPEAGTTTGLAISFDAWQGNTLPDGPDVEGIIVRLDNVTVETFPLPTRHGAGDDVTSAQTGPIDPSDDRTGSPDNLTWQPVEVELDENGRLTVKWKGATLLDAVQTDFFPSPGRLVLAGRTGGANQNQHVDNIVINTIPSETALFTGLVARPNGLTIEITDAPGSVVQPDTIILEVDGVTVPSDQVTTSKVGTFGNSIVYRKPHPELFAPLSTHVASVTYTTSDGETTTIQREFNIVNYVGVSPGLKVGAGSNPGFKVRPYQVAASATNIATNEANLRGENGDDISDPFGAYDADNDGINDFGERDANGFFDVPAVINFEQAGVGAGNFQDDSFSDVILTDHPFPGIPGITGSTDNFTMEIATYLEFPEPGVYTMGVNSDDGFKVSTGKSNRDVLGQVLGFFNGGRGSADTIFAFNIQEAGVYPFRLLYFEGGGGANLEWFTVLDDGTKVLVNDPNNDNSIKAFMSAAGVSANAPRVTATSLNAMLGTGIRADQAITASISGTTDISLTVDGSADGVTINGGEVSFVPPSLLPPGAVVDVVLSYGGVTSTITATVGNFIQVDPAWGGGTGSQPGFTWRTHQLSVGRGNSNALAEQQLRGELGDSVANGEFFDITGVINFNQDAPAAAGNFGAGRAGVFDVADEPIPGIPGSTGSTDNIAGEALTYISFPSSGLYQMGVNSDDGFAVRLYDAAFDVAPEDERNILLGTFDGGRGASDTLFSFGISEPGLYPFRLLWYEGGGGANVEWFTVAADGSRALVNGTQPGALQAFRNRSGGPTSIPELPTGGGEPDTLTIARDGGNVTIGWEDGTLQEADTVTGPYSNSADQSNPQTRAATGTKFFRTVE